MNVLEMGRDLVFDHRVEVMELGEDGNVSHSHPVEDELTSSK